MRILLAHNSTYFPGLGGGDKSNRLLMGALAREGHDCRVIARLDRFGREAHEEHVAALAARGVDQVDTQDGAANFPLDGVAVSVVTHHPNLRACFAAQLADFDPDVILTSTDDPGQLLLPVALEASRARVVYMIRAVIALPFGPEAGFVSEMKTQTLRQVDAVVAVSEYVARYAQQWGGLPAVSLPISLSDPGEPPALGHYGNEFVTLINPCPGKGISLFLCLADRFPDVAFAAVPTWGTRDEDRTALARKPNVTILNPTDHIDVILRRTRVLLVPSLWADARPRVVLEALSRGVPVLASDVGGIPEAMLGLDYVLPVRPVARYEARVDERMVPVAAVPEQDATPWEHALRDLLASPARYTDLAQRSRAAALYFLANLSVVPFARYLEEQIAAPRQNRAATLPVDPGALALERLSPERRALLARRMTRKEP